MVFNLITVVIKLADFRPVYLRAVAAIRGSKGRRGLVWADTRE